MMKASMLVFLACLASPQAQVKLNSQIRPLSQDNVRNWFDSVSKNDRRGAIENKNTIQKEVDQEQRAFNSMKRELGFAQRRNYLTRDKREDQGKTFKTMRRELELSKQKSHLNRDKREDSGHGTDRFTEEPRKKLPKGSDFSRILKKNMIYVDKTDIIHKMIETELCVILTRPSRFGKSLLVSTLSYLFEGGTSNKALFNGTKIKEIFGYAFPEHTVLQFDFSILRSESIDSFNESMHTVVGNFLIEHGINEQGCDPKVGVKHCTDVLLKTLKKKTGRKNVVLIDEYDDSLRNFKGNKSDRDKVLDIMREFFIILKANDRNMEFCFVTGSTKIALSEFFSGYNVATDISWLPEYETIVGFSRDELSTYFNGYIKAKALIMNVSEDKIIQLLDSHFEGYRFSLKDEHMYNSLDIINFFRATKGMDIASYHTKTDSMSVKKVIRKIPKMTLVLNLMAQLKTEEDMIPVDVAFMRGFGESLTAPEAVLKALYEGGFLSVKKHESVGLFEPDKYYIGFTNKVAREHFLKLSKNVIDKEEMGFNEEYDPGYKDALEERNMPSFLERLAAHCVRIPSLLVPKDKKLTESFYQLTVYYGLLLSGMRANWEVILNTGRLDTIAMTDNTTYIFELRRKDNPEWRDALKQCNMYTPSEYFRKRQVVCIGIVFENKPTVSRRVIHAWGMFEKFANGSFFPNRNSLDMNEYEAEGEPVSTIKTTPTIM